MYPLKYYVFYEKRAAVLPKSLILLIPQCTYYVTVHEVTAMHCDFCLLHFQIYTMAANSLSLKALLNPDIYTWHTSLTNPNLFQRQALGIETKWARRSSGSWPMYLSGRLSAKGKSIPQFEQASIVAWLRLRFQNPEIAARPVVEKDGSAVVKCQVPRNEAQAIEWATKTLTVERVTIWTETVNGAEEILRQRPEISDDLILVRIHSRIKGNVLEAEYAFSVDHRVTDGVGSHIIAGKYFRLLAEALGESQAEKIEWEHCAENLSPPWISIVNDQQQTEGTEFAEDVKKLGGRVTGGMVCAVLDLYSAQSQSLSSRVANGAWIIREQDSTHQSTSTVHSHLKKAPRSCAQLKRNSDPATRSPTSVTQRRPSCS